MLHSPHSSELAKCQLRSNLGQRLQLVLARLGSLHWYRRGMYTRPTPWVPNYFRGY